nr:pro-epidermal growth factor-like [Lytechinus pictus]
MGSLIFIIFLCICSSSAVDKVLFVDQINYGIYHSDIEPGKLLTQQVYQRARFEHIYRPGVMTYDFMTNMVIWGQRSPHKIGGDILDGVPNTVNIVPGIKPFLIAFNKHDRRIYWFGNVSLILASARLDGTNKIRVHVNDKRIFGLCIDGQNSMLYFSEGDSIMQMNVDGTGKKSLVDEDLVNVTAFTRNAQDGNLFWINHDRTIEMYDIVKHVRNIVTTISIELGYVEQILIYDDIFYWVDIGRGGIGYLNLLDHVRSGFTDSIPVNGEHQSLAGILRMKVFINESVDLCHPSPCEPGLQCVSTIYNYECVATNLTGNGTGSGATVEPHTHTNLCEASGEHYPCDYIRGVCLYVNGSAVCGCEGGYLLADDNITCLAPENCSHCDNGECVNWNGMYSCVCDEGFRPDAAGYCQDVNECENITCDVEFGVCMNTVGGYYCTCAEGFFMGGDGITCHGDVKSEDDDDDDDEYSEESSLCEIYEDVPWWKQQNNIIIVVVVVILVVIFLIIVIAICCRCKKRGDNKAV